MTVRVEVHAGVASGTGTAYDASIVTEYLSVLVTAWGEALGPHLAALTTSPIRREQSHAIAVVVMAAFAIESYAARLMVAKEWKGSDNVIAFVRQLDAVPSRDADTAEELFLVRDALVHNHIWRMRGTSSGGVFTAEGIEKLFGRSRAPVTADRRMTKRLRFNMIPELVRYTDARKAMAVLVTVTDALAAADVPNMRPIADTTRVELPDGQKPLLRRFGQMPTRPPTKPWPPSSPSRRR